MYGLERIDDDDLRRELLDGVFNMCENDSRPTFRQMRSQIVEDDLSAYLRLIVEREHLQVANHLRHGFSHGREIQDRTIFSRIPKYQGFNQNAFAGARLTHNDIDGVGGKTAREYLVNFGVTGGEAIELSSRGLRHLWLSHCGLSHCAPSLRLLEFDLVRRETISTMRCGCRGLDRKTSAPASRARSTA